MLRKHCFLPMFRHVSQDGQTLGNNVSATKITLGKHEMFLNLIGNICCFPGSKFRFRNNVSTGGQTGKLWGNIASHKCFRNNVSATMFPSLPWALYIQSIEYRYNICLVRTILYIILWNYVHTYERQPVVLVKNCPRLRCSLSLYSH